MVTWAVKCCLLMGGISSSPVSSQAPSSHPLLLLAILRMKTGISVRAGAFVQYSSGQMATTPDKALGRTLSIPFLVKSGDLNASFSTLADRTTKELLKPPIARHHSDPQDKRPYGRGQARAGFRGSFMFFICSWGWESSTEPQGQPFWNCACVPWGLFINEDSGDQG